MAIRILSCTFPFPAQTPPTSVAAPCIQCPNADRAVLDLHDAIARDDPILLGTLRDFANWFFAPDSEESAVEECVRYAADLYTRADHTGTCIPKTILFAYYKGLQFVGSEGMPSLSERGLTGLKGETVASWPNGEPRQGLTWAELFADYGRRYD